MHKRKLAKGDAILRHIEMISTVLSVVMPHEAEHVALIGDGVCAQHLDVHGVLDPQGVRPVTGQLVQGVETAALLRLDEIELGMETATKEEDTAEIWTWCPDGRRQ